MLFGIDLVWNWCVQFCGQKFVYRLLLVSTDLSKAVSIADEFVDHATYATTPLAVTDLTTYQDDARDGCVIV